MNTSSLASVLKTIDLSLSEVLPRFLYDEHFFLDVLISFLQNSTLTALKEALQQSQLDEAVRLTYNISETASSLGLTRIYQSTQGLLQLLPSLDQLCHIDSDTVRSQACLQTSKEKLMQHYEVLQEQYQLTASILPELLSLQETGSEFQTLH